MKIKTISTITCLLILIGCSNLVFSMGNAPAEIVLNYFQACKNGDVSTMKSLITDRFYQRRRVLLEQNEQYPEFLKSRYSAMQFQIVSSEIEEISGYAQVVLQQTSPGGTSTDSTLILRQDAGGFWKISDEVMPE